MRIEDLFESSIKIDHGNNYTLVIAKYQPRIQKHRGPSKFVFANMVLNTNFGKFLLRCLQTPVTTQKSQLRNAGYKVLKKYGIPDIRSAVLPKRASIPNIGWSGSHLYTDSLDGEGLFHEISHWIVTTAQHRNQPDYAMGSGFNSKDEFKSSRTDRSNQMEENEALVLQMCLMRAAKGKAFDGLYVGDFFETIPKKAIEELNLSSDEAIHDVVYFDQLQLMKLASAYERLISRGLISNNGDPRWAVGISN